MGLSAHRLFSSSRTVNKHHLPVFAFAAAAILIALCVPAVGAQQRNNNDARKSSELSAQNLSRVAASAAEIKSVLLKDPGLMVELKRWVAKDATDHGQIVSDADLTDDAMFERLESDVPFRAVATLLVQRYGYLQPRVNPDSEAGKERRRPICFFLSCYRFRTDICANAPHMHIVGRLMILTSSSISIPHMPTSESSGSGNYTWRAPTLTAVKQPNSAS